MLEDPSHGRWYYWIKVTDAVGLAKRVPRGGFVSEEAAIAARDAAVAEPSRPEEGQCIAFHPVADFAPPT